MQGTEVLLRDGNDTRSSPHLSMVTLGCLNEGDERGEGQGRYSSWLSLRLEMDPATRIVLPWSGLVRSGPVRHRSQQKSGLIQDQT
jgi:hypothetical protein